MLASCRERLCDESVRSDKILLMMKHDHQKKFFQSNGLVGVNPILENPVQTPFFPYKSTENPFFRDFLSLSLRV